MDDKLEIRRYERSDIPALNEIMGKVYGFTKEESFWIWKYEENPAGKCYSYVAESNGRPIAHCGGFAITLQMRGEKIMANQLGDLLSDPERRVKNAFSFACGGALNFPDPDGPMISYGFANTNSTAIIVAKTELILKGPSVPRQDRLVNLTPFIHRKLKLSALSRTIGFWANQAMKLYYAAAGVGRTNTTSIEQVEEFDARFDDLWNEVAVDYPRTSHRTSEHLTWRYIKHPTHEYKIFAFVEDDKVRGYIVLRLLPEKDITRGLIIDLISDVKRPDVWNALLVRGIDYLTREGADLISCWMFESMPFYDSLKKLRFFDRPSDLSILVYDQTGKMDLEFLNARENWYVTMGDSDIF
jgi:hypothetical protein